VGDSPSRSAKIAPVSPFANLIFTVMATLPSSSSPSFVPYPVLWEPGKGVFRLDERTAIVAPGEAEALGFRLRSYLAPATGLPLRVSARGGANAIHLRLDGKQQGLGPEGYRLAVKGDRVEIAAPEKAGLFYGIQTLRQMLPSAVFRQGRVEGVGWTVPQGTVEDKPRFSWRGGHLDVGRHFFPKEFLLKFIDLLALHKLNVFHLHLTEDQGWRIEIKRYPKLTQVGAWRKDTMLTYNPPTYTGKPHGGFYTQDDLREVVAYAKERFVTVVPEIEMPGHSQAAIAAYPELGNDPGRQLEVATRWGVIPHVYNVEDSTIRFLQNVLDEVLDIFPSTFIHVGGDECPKDEWRASPRAQARIKELGLKDEHELQSWFIKQMDTFLTSKGRRLIGWDEILEGGLAPGATVMSWRGEEGGIAAAKAGHDVVMAPNDFTYFDHYQGPKEKEPHAIGGFTDIEQVYGYEPVPAALQGDLAKHELGSQFQLWSEYFPNAKHVEYMAFPRACAMAEVLWSPREARNYNGFLARLPFHLDRLTGLDVNYRR
jgi:hexosaminidase